MSCYEWEAGEFKLSVKEYAKFKKALREAWNKSLLDAHARAIKVFEWVKAKYKGKKPSFYGAQSYDAANLIASAVNALNGDLSDKKKVQAALEKADFKSVRGNFKYGPNHFPIQNFYLQVAEKDGGDYVLKTVATIVENDQDRYYKECSMK